MSQDGDSFVAEDFFRLKRGDVVLWSTASLMVICGIVAGIWAYQTYLPKSEPAGPPSGAMVVEFAEFATSPVTEELEVPEADPSVASVATPPSEVERDPEAEPIEEPEPVVEEPPPGEIVEPEEVVEPEPIPEPTPEPPPEPEAIPEPVEPIIEVPEVEVPEPAVVLPRRMAAVFPPIPEPMPEPPEVVEPPPEEAVEPEEVEPVLQPEPQPEPEPVEPPDPNLPLPVTMSQRVAEVRAETPPTKFTPPQPRRTPPPKQQASSQTSAPKPAAQQAQQAAAPQQAPTAPPSSSQVNRWESSVFRHLGQRRKFPPDARARGEKGEVVVQFTIDASGRVLSVSIARSSGFASLDQAARDLVLGASPVPAPPAGIERSRLTVGMPIDYTR